MRLDVWSDFACPWCLLGKRRLEHALEGRDDVDVHWRAYELQPDMPADGQPRSVLERKLGGPERLQQAQARITGLGAAIGLQYAFEKQQRMSNTRLAHRAVALAGEHRAALVDALFRAHFEEGLDLSPRSAVVDVAAAVGLDRPTLERALQGDGGLKDVLADQALAGELGIRGVPCFVADMKVSVSGAQEVETFRQFLEEAASGPRSPAG